LPAIAALYAGDELAAQKGDFSKSNLAPAFADIEADPNNHVFVAEEDGQVLGTFQLTFIRQLSYGGCWVAQVESVQVDARYRSRGIGARMLHFAIERARDRGCYRVQLTSNVTRQRAHAFYARLGFKATHSGMKLIL
jgi:GNAT superfamily N-acetyltransferase